MAKKKQEEPETPTQDTPEDKDLEYKDIKDKSLEQTVREDIESRTTSEEKEEPVEEEPTEEDPVEEKKEVDTGAIAEDVTKKAMDEIGKKLGFVKEDVKQAEDKGLVAPWEKEGRNPKDYNEVAEWGATVAEHKIKTQQEEAQKQQEEQQEAQKTRKEQLNSYWDEQLTEIRQSGKLPKVADPKDDNDPGKQAEADLFMQLTKYNQERVAQGKPQELNLKAFVAFNYKPKRQQPAGADLPIGGAGYTQSPAQEEGEFDYKDIHGKSIEDVVRGR